MLGASHSSGRQLCAVHVPGRKGGRPASGFTLIEAVMVVLFVAILVTAGVPRMVDALNGMKLTAAADEVITALRYAQSLSMKEENVYGVEFDKVLNTFRCYRVATGETILHPLDKKPYEIDLNTLGHVKGALIEDALFGASVDYVEFDPEGETAPLTTDPTTAGAVVLKRFDAVKTVSVSAPLGRATIQ